MLATKFTNQTDPDDPNSADNHRKKIITSIEASLRRLQTDHIDLYWVHNRDVLTSVEELMRALDDQVRLGKVLYPAVSDWAAWEIAEASTAARLRAWSPFTAVQLRYNLLDRTPERELLPMAAALDLPAFAWGPLAEGRLTGKYLSGHTTGRVTEAGRPYTRAGSDDIVRDVVAISREIGCSPAQVAISWVRQQPGRVIPLIAARTEEQFRDNLARHRRAPQPAAPGPPRRTQPAHPRVPRRRHARGLRRRRDLRRPATRHRRPPRPGRAPHHHRHLAGGVVPDRTRPSRITPSSATCTPSRW